MSAFNINCIAHSTSTNSHSSYTQASKDAISDITQIHKKIVMIYKNGVLYTHTHTHIKHKINIQCMY